MYFTLPNLDGTASNHIPVRSMFIITAQLYLTYSDARNRDKVNIHFLDLVNVTILSFNTSHYVVCTQAITKSYTKR